MQDVDDLREVARHLAAAYEKSRRLKLRFLAYLIAMAQRRIAEVLTDWDEATEP